MAGVVDTGEALTEHANWDWIWSRSLNADPCQFWITASSMNSPWNGPTRRTQDCRTQEYPLGSIAQDWPNDIEIRIRQTRSSCSWATRCKLCNASAVVKSLTDKGMERLADIADRLAPLSVEAPPRRNGRARHGLGPRQSQN